MATNSEKKEKSLAEFIVIVVLVGVMMAVFINYFIKSEDQFTHAGFTTIAQSFNTKVRTVHAQWLMDKQPNVVLLASFNKKEKQAISVNNKGWIDVQNKQLACEKIWQLVMETPMNLMKLSISAIEVHDNTNEKNDPAKAQCRYVLLGGSYFHYNRSNGKVSKVTMID
jgi:competence protein ComGC